VLNLKQNIIFFFMTFLTQFYYSGAYNLESFLDLGSNKDYKIPNIQSDEGCNIQLTSVSKIICVVVYIYNFWEL